MKRRSFLRNIALTAPITLGGIPIKLLSDPLLIQQFSCQDIADRVLVMVQLSGGNDGLNTLIPVDQYSQYKTHRPTVGINDSGTGSFTNLDTTLPIAQQVGIQPDFMAMKDLYDQGKVNFIHDVSYSNINRSHFKGTDIWLAGKDATSPDTSSGFLGRYLNERFIDYPASYPNADMPDPIALQLGSSALGMAFNRQEGLPMGLALAGDPTNFYSLVSGVGGAVPSSIPNTAYGAELNYIMSVQGNMNAYASRLDQIYQAGSNSVSYPSDYHISGKPGNQLAPQLQTVARLLSGGSKTRIFLVKLGGFDHHSSLVEEGSPHLGKHAILLYHLSEALRAFQTDLEGLGLEDKVLTMTFSEFGRGVIENGNFGTDHGTSAPMMIIGKGVIPGVTGNNPDLSSLDGNHFTSFQHDYRRIFTGILQDWLGAGDLGLGAAELNQFANDKLDLINNNYIDPTSGESLNFIADPSCYDYGMLTSSFPIKLAEFFATAKENYSVECTWKTSSELNNEVFVVERSRDGMLYEPVGEVPGAGNSQTLQSYAFTDSNPYDNTSYYRLKQVDFDGRFTYSESKEVHLDPRNKAIANLTFFPNPVVNQLNLHIDSQQNVTAQVRICKSNGATVLREQINLRTGENHHLFDCSTWSNGMYFIEAITQHKGENKRIGWGKIVKY